MMKIRLTRGFLRCGLAAFIVGVSTTHAQTDLDENGLPDVWESLFSLPVGALATDDNDGDGWTNAEEAQAGTDPLDGSGYDPQAASSDGGLGVCIEKNQTSGKFDVRCWGVGGKLYKVLVSDDLVTWTEAGQEDTGVSGHLPISTNVAHDGSEAPRKFWRLTVEDTDADGDGYSAYEEAIFGTNPDAVTNTDGDSLTDEWEQFHFGDLDEGDSGNPDNDDLTNEQESFLGTDSSQDEPTANPDAKTGYVYDDAGRLTNANGTPITLTFTVDEEGNIQSVN